MTGLEKINIKAENRARILIAPLDWGLGHTTRCLPIIKAFLELGAEIVVACNANQARLLACEIPNIRLLDLKGYDIRYSRKKWRTWIKIFLQIPKILTAINKEKEWLNSLLKRERFDIIISDNRFGFHHPSVYSIYMTHQLRVKVPFSRWIENQLQKWNYGFIAQFNECWIPDYEGSRNLAGELSHPAQLPRIKTKYLGALSRFEANLNSDKSFPELIALISGPEPQRTIFEELLINELRNFQGNAVVVRGLPNENRTRNGFGSVSFFNHLPTAELQGLLCNSRFVICRSGYSSIMDMIALRRRCILVPTPGQTEQEYLAAFAMKNKWGVAFSQKDFSLQNAVASAEEFEYADRDQFNTHQVESIIKEFMQEHFKETQQPNAPGEN